VSEVCFLKEKKGRKENEGEYMPLHKLRYFIVAMLVLSCLLVADFVEAKEVSTARTEGVIRFVGGQEPEKPEPKPPTGEWRAPEEDSSDSAKNDRFPQTNSHQQLLIRWIGLLLVLLSVVAYLKRCARRSANEKNDL
jgi:LPXTG-motif cell wall-anchored protein